MEKEESDSIWLPPLSLIVIGLIVAATWFLEPSSLRLTGQALGMILIVRAFCYWPPFVRWLTGMPVPHRLIFFLLVGGMIAGHYTISTRTFYPFVAWEIFPFVDERDPVTCPQFIATTSSGKEVRLLTEQLFPSVVQLSPLDKTELFPPQAVEHLARVLAKAYNDRHPDDLVRQVSLVKVSVQLHPPPGVYPTREWLQRYDISSAR